MTSVLSETGAPPPADRLEIVLDASEAEAAEQLCAWGFTDGLPVVVPTPSRVEAMCAGARHYALESLGNLAPRGGAATLQKIAREHNYNFRPSMPALLSGAAATIAVVVPTLAGRQTEVSDPFFQELISGLSEAGRLAGCDMLISYLAPKNQDDLASIMTANRAEGVIFLGQKSGDDAVPILFDQFAFPAHLFAKRICDIDVEPDEFARCGLFRERRISTLNADAQNIFCLRLHAETESECARGGS